MTKDIHDRVTRNEVDIDELEDRLKELENNHKSPWWRHPSVLKMFQHAMWILGLVIAYFTSKGNADGN